MSEWMPIETAPKGTPGSRRRGPEILGIIVGDGWSAMSIVQWVYHKDPARGNWHGPHGVWTPDMWMPLPAPPAAMKDGDAARLEAQRAHDARRRG